MESQNNESKIDRLSRGLYSRKAPSVIDPGRTDLEREKSEAPSEWQSGETPETGGFDALAARVAHKAESHHSLAKKIFFGSLFLFGVSVLVASFVFFGGSNLISSKNVDIKVVGPVSVAGGQETSFDVLVQNKNNTDLESVNLTVDYPPGVRDAESLTQDVASRKFSLGNIASGDESSQTVKVFIFGKKEEVKQFKLSVDYKVKNSNGNFFKEKLYEMSISSSPIIITSIYPKEINSGQEINFVVEVASNSSTSTLEDFLVHVNYPFGFSYKQASPAPTSGNNTWRISDLKTGGKQMLNIIGTLSGQDNEERVFKVSAGSPDGNDERNIGITFLSSNESIFIKKPFIGLDLKLGGNTGDYVVRGASAVDGSVLVRNNLPEKIFNVYTEVSFSGSAFSSSGIFVGEGGFFRSLDNTISWDKRVIPEFTEFGPGDAKSLSFRFAPVAYKDFMKGLSPEIKVKVKSEADRILESGAVEHVRSLSEGTVRLGTDLTVNQKIVRTEGGISNTGPIPPKVNQKTTYTVAWSVSNTWNNVSNVMVKTTLPTYVDWVGTINPSNSLISFDVASHQVIWNVGQLPAGTGFGSQLPKTVYFQISFLPSTSQVGTVPELLGNSTVSGIDKVTSLNVESSTSGLNTRFADPSFHDGDDRVIN